MSQQNKLIIREFPLDTIIPFINPTCRETYQSLPRIYGKKEKKRYFLPLSDQHNKPAQPRMPKDCCLQQQEAKEFLRSRPQLESRSNLERITSELRHEDSRNYQQYLERNASVEQRRLKTLQFKESSSKRHKKIILPNLKVFDSQDLKDTETTHKVYQAGTSIERQDYLSDRYQNLSDKKTKVQVRNNEAQTERQTIQHYEDVKLMNDKYEQRVKSDNQLEMGKKSKKKEHPLKEKKAKYEEKEKMKTEVDMRGLQTPESKQYYVYLENRTEVKATKDNTTAKRNRKELDIEADQVYNIISCTPPQSEREDKTMFHYNKQRENTAPSLKKTIQKKKVAPFITQKEFGLKKDEDISSILINYKPISPDFDLKYLAKQPDFVVLPFEDKLYFGQMREGNVKEGTGVTLAQNYIYEGVYKQNQKVEGAERGSNGLYIGSFKNGKRHGQGKFTWNNGECFEGEWQNGKKNGFGVWKSPRGDYYQGEWKDNKQNGKGYFIHKNNSTYRGYFRQFLKHGKGEEEFVNGDKYTGEFQNGKPHGYGRYVWQNGDSFEGEFVEGSREGKGVSKKATGSVYEGHYKNDMRHGHGKERFKSGEYFEGEYRKNEQYKGKYYSKAGQEMRPHAPPTP